MSLFIFPMSVGTCYYTSSFNQSHNSLDKPKLLFIKLLPAILKSNGYVHDKQ